jgi:phosphoglucomutase
MNTLEKYGLWLKNVEDKDLKEELISIKDSPEEINNRFYKSLEFGTAGLRGVLGAGTNYMNYYTVGQTTQAICNYMTDLKYTKVVISYDSRIMSAEFSKYCATIFAKNGITAYLVNELQPTPVLSYLVRQLQTNIGIMITASHNPAIYNGYKVYDHTGCQISIDLANIILKYISNVDYFNIQVMDYKLAIQKDLIKIVDEKYYSDFLEEAKKIRLFDFSLENINISYTPLNGTGWKLVPEILRSFGTKVNVVKEQGMPDGRFTTCPFPNPELLTALTLGINDAKENNSLALIATDPDCDRVGLVVKHNNEYVNISGNTIGLLLTDYIVNNKKLPKNPVFTRSIVTSSLVDSVLASKGINITKVLTGFKYVGEVLNNIQDIDNFVFGYEESNGYLGLPYVRDKDGVATSLLIVEMIAYYNKQGKTLLDRLHELYSIYGAYVDKMYDYYLEGEEGGKKILAIMESLRKNPIKEILGVSVIETIDYSVGINGLDKTNAIELNLKNSDKVIFRPSGTEPKIKVYVTFVGEEDQINQRIQIFKPWLDSLILK